MMQLEPIVSAQAEELSAFAHPIWMEVFGPMLPGGNREAAYFADNWQSPAAIRQQMNEGLSYFYFRIDGQHAGYCAARPEGVSLFVSKLYLLPAYRGRGLGTAMIGQVLDWGKKQDLRRAYLHVNVHNARAIKVYRHNGFQVQEHVVTKVGEYDADDYVMVRTI